MAPIAPDGLGQAAWVPALLGLLLGLAALLATVRQLRGSRRALRQAVDLLAGLTPDRLLKEDPPRLPDRRTQAAVDHLWAVSRGLTAREGELAAQNGVWQRRYGQARGLIDLMAEFNQVMQLRAVLDRLSHGVSRFFAGDGVAIWIRGPRGDLELAASVVETFPPALPARDRWVEHVLAGGGGPMLPTWLAQDLPCLAAPLFDAQGQRIGIVAVTSRRRAAYTVEDDAFLRTAIAHAAMAVQNATLYEFVDTLSRVDSLTGLHNRREFDRLVNQELTRAQSSGQTLSLLMVDIDHFKRVNDERGHQEGDRALQQVARLVQTVPQRATDGAFRTGGEEFAVLMTQADKATALAAAESLRGVAEGVRLLGDGMSLTLSVGVASYPGDAQEPATLIAAADRALYQAKAAGRNRVQAA